MAIGMTRPIARTAAAKASPTAAHGIGSATPTTRAKAPAFALGAAIGAIPAKRLKPMDDKFRADLRERQLKSCNDRWYEAAKRALNGDDRALRGRVEQYEEPPMPIRASVA